MVLWYMSVLNGMMLSTESRHHGLYLKQGNASKKAKKLAMKGSSACDIRLSWLAHWLTDRIFFFFFYPREGFLSCYNVCLVSYWSYCDVIEDTTYN